MRARVILVCLSALMVIDVPAAASESAMALADRIGLPTSAPVFVGDDADIDGSSRESDDLKKAANLATLPRRATWAAGWLCAEHGDFACALERWHAAAQAAPSPPRWVPEAYALALWGLDRHEQAVAWYDTAVLGTAHLGNGNLLPKRYTDASLYKMEVALFERWSQMLAPLRKTVVTAVDIDGDGRVERVQVLDEQLDPTLAHRIQQVVADWRFTPATKKGEPARLSTHVFVEVRGRPDGEQRMVFDVQFNGIGVRAVHRVGPTYPATALSAGKDGMALVVADIDAHGKVMQTHLDVSSGSPLLDKAALKAAKRWRFAADRIDGEPVASSVKLPFVFVIGTDADATPFNHRRDASSTRRSGIAF